MRLDQAVALTCFLPHWESGVILPLFGFYRDARPGIRLKNLSKATGQLLSVLGKLRKRGCGPILLSREDGRFGEKTLRNNRDRYIEASAD